MSTATNLSPSTDELKLFTLMMRDCDVLRARELEDETATPAPKRSPEARAKIAAAMRGNTNRKSKSQPAIVSPIAQHRKGRAHG